MNGSLEDYLSALKVIFEKCASPDRDVIFMTPNMLNTRVADDTEEQYMAYAAVTAEYQNGGRMDRYMESAVSLAHEMGVKVCDCYAEWKKIAEREDVTNLLANRINHPTREMHALFADMLFDIIFDKENGSTTDAESTMYRR